MIGSQMNDWIGQMNDCWRNDATKHKVWRSRYAPNGVDGHARYSKWLFRLDSRIICRSVLCIINNKVSRNNETLQRWGWPRADLTFRNGEGVRMQALRTFWPLLPDGFLTNFSQNIKIFTIFWSNFIKNFKFSPFFSYIEAKIVNF